MRPLVILRPEPGASETARAAEALGIRPILMPLFSIEPLDWVAPEPTVFDSLLVTSANAVRHAGPGLNRLRNLPAICVGEATATAAREAGLHLATVGTFGIDAVLETIEPGTRLLHLCGADRRRPANPSAQVEAVEVYRAVERDPGERLADVEDAVVAVHSPRSAAVLARRAGEANLRIGSTAICAISPAAAQAAGPGWKQVEAAPQPTRSALLSLARRLCDKTE